MCKRAWDVKFSFSTMKTRSKMKAILFSLVMSMHHIVILYPKKIRYDLNNKIRPFLLLSQFETHVHFRWSLHEFVCFIFLLHKILSISNTHQVAFRSGAFNGFFFKVLHFDKWKYILIIYPNRDRESIEAKTKWADENRKDSVQDVLLLSYTFCTEKKAHSSDIHVAYLPIHLRINISGNIFPSHFGQGRFDSHSSWN